MARRKGVVLDECIEPTEEASATGVQKEPIIHPDKTHSIEGVSKRFKLSGTPFECDEQGRVFIPEKMLKNLLTNP